MNEEPIVPPPGTLTEDFIVVGIGASAGGLRALMEFFQAMPPNSGMAFVVVVHLSPEHESRMHDVLQQVTAMPVTAVNERVRIQPDPIYVIPLVMGASMFALSWIGQRGLPPNPQTKMMMYIMPGIFTFMFLKLSSGLNLYYAVSNVASLPQQWLISQERRRKLGERVRAKG